MHSLSSRRVRYDFCSLSYRSNTVCTSFNTPGPKRFRCMKIKKRIVFKTISMRAANQKTASASAR